MSAQSLRNEAFLGPIMQKNKNFLVYIWFEDSVYPVPELPLLPQTKISGGLKFFDYVLSCQ